MGCCVSNAKPFNYKNDIPNYKIYTHVRVWNQNNTGLFDYGEEKEIHDSYTCTNSYFQIKDNWFFTSKDDKVAMFTPISEEDKEGHSLILTVAFKNGRYWFYQCREFTYQDALENPAEQAWIVLKEMNPAIMKEKMHK